MNDTVKAIFLGTLGLLIIIMVVGSVILILTFEEADPNASVNVEFVNHSKDIETGAEPSDDTNQIFVQSEFISKPDNKTNEKTKK